MKPNETLLNGRLMDFDYLRNLPVSHKVPLYPALHLHVYPFTASWQVAPLRHGPDPHSLISGSVIIQNTK